jgi:hypothetical protein
VEVCRRCQNHKWFHKDISDPEKWIRETSPSGDSRVEVTDADADSAINPLQYSPWDRFSRRVSSIWQRLPRRPHSRNNISEVRDEAGAEGDPPQKRSLTRKSSTNTKKEKSRPSTSMKEFKESKVNVPMRSKSVERWIKSKPSISTSTLTGSSPKARRGSENSSNNSPPHSRSAGYDSGEQPPRHDIRSWFKPNRRSRKSCGTSLETSAAASSQDASKFSSTSQDVSFRDPMSRGSGDVIREHTPSTRRVSSWNTGYYVADLGSLHSGDNLSDRVMLEGAGGVIDSAPYQAFRRANHLMEGNVVASSAPPVAGDIRQVQGRSTTPIPLIRVRSADVDNNDPCLSDNNEYDSSSLDCTDGPFSIVQRPHFVGGKDEDDSDNDGIVVSHRLSRTRPATQPHNNSDEALS